ncbi:MAG: hypothetical protein KGM97_06505, partial [Alphaproteobacteria bacterium]|nr:hypothetical protein [Alphaproteobacteria bacterium]
MTKMRPGLTILSLATMTWGATLPAFAVGAFHPAKTPAEIALDGILHRADADPRQLANLLHRPGADGRVDYARMLTPALVAAMSKAEKTLVRKDCGGKYLKDEICGLDYSPLTCAQDSSPSYIYHTILELPGRTVIEYAWPGGKVAEATYTLIEDKS